MPVVHVPYRKIAFSERGRVVLCMRALLFVESTWALSPCSTMEGRNHISPVLWYRAAERRFDRHIVSDNGWIRFGASHRSRFCTPAFQLDL